MGHPEARLEAEAGVGLAAEELAGAGAAGELIFVDDGAAAGEDGFCGALNLDAFEHGIVDAHVMRLGADDFAMIGIEDDDVGVGADGDCAFAREEAEEFCGRGGDDFDETIGREAFAVDAAGVDEAEAMLDAGAAVGNFCEVVDAELFLVFEAERAMIGGDDLQRVLRESLPEFFLVPLFAERRSEDVFGAFEAGGVHVFEREIEILRTGFGVGGDAAVAGFANFFESVVAGEMDDVDGAVGHFGESDGAGGGFGFGGRGARECVIFRSFFSFGEGLLDDDVDGAAVFGVHADEAGMFCGLAHGLEDGGVVEHEDAGIGHEEFEAGDAFADEVGHFFELRAAEVGDDAVEGVVDGGFVVGFGHPGVEGVAEGLAFVLDGEIDERRGAAEGCGDCAGLEVVGAGGAAEGHVEMGVDVDAAGEEEEIGASMVSVAFSGGRVRRRWRRFCRRRCRGRRRGVGGGDDGAVFDDGVESHSTDFQAPTAML